MGGGTTSFLGGAVIQERKTASVIRVLRELGKHATEITETISWLPWQNISCVAVTSFGLEGEAVSEKGRGGTFRPVHVTPR